MIVEAYSVTGVCDEKFFQAIDTRIAEMYDAQFVADDDMARITEAFKRLQIEEVTV